MRPFLAALFTCLPALAAAETPVLTVMTYDSFASEWGPGPQVEKAFEEVCGCDLRFITGGDGAAMLARLRLEGAASEADVLLGLDTNLTADARDTGLFAPHDQPAATGLPVAYRDEIFLPYDWSWFAFVYDKNRLASPPGDFAALAASDLKIVIQDPRSSTPGLGLLMWVKAAFGAEAPQIWSGLADNILTVTPGWSEAYGLFLEGEADMVLSYTSSPAYHRLAEQDDSKEWASFSEGHYLQIELAAILAASKQPGLAQDFLAFTRSPAFQSVIPETNWMYPASEIALPEGFETRRPEKSLLLDENEARSLRQEALSEWQSALAR
ncbi:thiamine ABC transporter substrate binding subunit [Pseudogemmobacter faecipullorum]|uniref:Thiamine-binding periplasmic protein n=1 Tax=Pseudogemmobacter faecipullorum TaxID=2755041 RepID=A0ABS8CHB1_9RHOB|nr:thiamine ABC transporter substrate binding subunit [Pseudogemmobacter faecipullorum]MCB5408772.1 thiamine ABC transporter substrate binding subunit [Pseudogemmobacter faecipullorum]